MKKGTEYEIFVENIFNAIIHSEAIFKQKNIVIERHKIIKDNLGINREFDLYWEYELYGIIYKTIIECKDYSQKISIDKIDSLIGKLHDIPNIKAIFATTKGYQTGALEKAKRHGIELLIARRQNNSDWFDKNGIPYIRTININFQIESNIRVDMIKPFLDREWIEKNSSLNIDDFKGESILDPNVVVIKDNEKKHEKKLINYLEEINSEKHSPGNHVKEVNFDNAFIVISNTELKLKQLIIEFYKPETTNMPIVIDYSKELYGVIEYLSTSSKKTLLNSGRIISE